MSYKGQIFRIPLGSRGLTTDEVQSRTPIDALLLATNVSFRKNFIEKEPGSVRWNSAALPASVLALSDFWPNDVSQRVFALCANQKLYRYIDRIAYTEVTPSSVTDTQDLVLASDRPPAFVTGGAEDGGDRKLFLFTGTSQVQVISGDATTRHNITKPAADWVTSFPSYGLIHAGRLCAFGNKNLPHMLYLSAATDHEDFQTPATTLFFPVFPGEGEGILSAYNFKGRLFIFKYPFGVYYLDDTDPSVTNWSIKKLTGSFGVASAFSVVEALNDAFVANHTGSITQMSATLDFGSMTTGDLLRNLRNESYMRQITARFGFRQRYGVWYEDKKTALFTYQSSGGTKNDLMLVIDFNDPQTPKVSWSTKDQANCLTLVKDMLGVPRPFYGATDGYIYRMDHPTWDVAGTAYEGRFRTINLDFGQADPSLAEREKLYDFLEISFEETGSWPLTIKIYIDNYYSETVTVTLTKRDYLDTLPGVHNTFLLGPTGVNQALGRGIQSQRIPIHGKGRRISLECYNAGLRQNFRITDLAVYFRLSGQAQKG